MPMQIYPPPSTTSTNIYPPVAVSGGTGATVYHGELAALSSKASTTTIAAEASMTFANLTAGTYIWTSMVNATHGSSNGPAIRMLVSPTPTSNTLTLLVVPRTSGQVPQNTNIADAQVDTAYIGGDGTTSANTAFLRGRFVIAATSTFSFNWGPQSNSATPVVLGPGTAVTVTKIA